MCICSQTSQSSKTLQDINNMLHIVCMLTEQLERLQLCTDAMSHSRGVLYNSFIDQLHLYKGAAHAASLQAYIQYSAYYLYLAKLWASSWSKSICTLYNSSYSTPFIDPLHLSKGEPVQHFVGTYTVCSIFIISLLSLILWLVQEQTNTIYSKTSWSTPLL